MKLEKVALLYRFLFTISLCFCIASTGEAQNGNSYTPAIPTIIPPSPISQTYQRFMGFQPELSTGAVNVTIPLHTISYDNFTLPFNLNYQSNGIKCSDSNYPLGYGWALYPGLRITRTIQGNADELAPKKYHYDSLESFSYNNKGLYFMSVVNKNSVIVKAINFEIKDNLLEYIKINDDEKYGFHYNDKRFGSIYEQDFWGYYNGAGSKNTYYTHPSYTYQILQYNSLRFLTGADRKPNNAYVDANILEQVDYPTGGYTRFEYEPHRYFWNHKIQTGGGLRVKRTITTTNAMYGDDKPIIRDYKHGMNECGYGKCSIEPNEETFASELFCRNQSGLSDYSYRQTTVHPNSLYAGYLLFNLPIWYNDVTEYITDNGRICYKYDYENDKMIFCDSSLN